jgi:transcriptional regulator with XRE-family HTH domain
MSGIFHTVSEKSIPKVHRISAVAEPTVSERFGHKLRQLRREKSAAEERDVGQGEVADAIGESQPNLARYESGRLPRDENTVRKLAEYYKVNYVWLRLDEGEKRPEPRGRPVPKPIELDAKRRKRG